MSRTALATVVILLSVACSVSAAANARVHGVVTDESGGVLPGVVVVAAAHDGRVLGTATSDAVGAFVFEALPAIPIRLQFQLDGFSAAVCDIAVTPAGNVLVKQKLTVAARSEAVTVVGTAPPSSPPPPPVVALTPPRPVLAPIVEHARESVCGPTKVSTAAETFGTIRGKQFGSENGLYFAGDQLLVDRGSADGLAVAQNLVARRPFKTAASSAGTTAAHTAGVVQVVEVSEHRAVVMVVYACDEIMRGDALAAFKPEFVTLTEAAGTPAFDDAARILFADEGQLVGVPRRLMVIDRGDNTGVRTGQRFTLFRRARTASGSPVVLGDAVVVSVQADSATIRIEHASDTIRFSDLAAPQRPAERIAGRPQQR
jgi:Carboxypeptidase regulatory-like domain